VEYAKYYLGDNDTGNENYCNKYDSGDPIRDASFGTMAIYWGNDASRYTVAHAFGSDYTIRNRRNQDYSGFVKGFRFKDNPLYGNAYDYINNASTAADDIDDYFIEAPLDGYYDIGIHAGFQNFYYDVSVNTTIVVYEKTGNKKEYDLITIALEAGEIPIYDASTRVVKQNIQLKRGDRIAVRFTDNTSDVLVPNQTSKFLPPVFNPDDLYYSIQVGYPVKSGDFHDHYITPYWTQYISRAFDSAHMPFTFYDPSNSYIDFQLNNTLVDDETTFDLNDMLPVNYKQKDFVNDILKMFNMYVTTDEVDQRKLYLKTYEDFFGDSSIEKDWTEKIVEATVAFEPTKNSLSSEFDFTMAGDSDVYNEDFANRYNKNFNDIRILNTSEFASGTDNISLSFSGTAMRGVNEYWNLSVPSIINGQYEYNNTWNPRLLFFNTTDISSNYGLEAYIDTDITKWNTLSTRRYNDVDLSSNIFMGFNSEISYNTQDAGQTNETLYNKYYKNELESYLSNGSYILKAKAYLNNNDIATMDFSDTIIFNSARHGYGKYRINEIKNYTNGGTVCDIELIKINKDFYYD